VAARGARWFNGSWLLGAGVFLAVAGTLVAVVFLSQRVGSDDIPPAPPPFAYTAPETGVTRGTVRQVTAAGFSVALDAPAGQPQSTVEISLAPATTVELLRPARAGDVRPGDWLTVVGIPNEVRNFSAHAFIAIPQPYTVDGERAARTPGGFAGHETATNERDRVLLGGEVVRVEGNVIVLRGPAGEVRVEVVNAATAPLYRLAAATPADVRDGDRLAIRGVPGGAPAALLAQPPAR
jgi:hypothetical protein